MTQHARYLCIHGHFYQPPRENPWLEAIERQDSAYPFHDWNERVAVESYAPNAVSRTLDEDGLIRELSNNYERISFNFGPTLLQWLEDHLPSTYEAVLDADRRSIERFRGHGSALAQVYNHLIMPLANDRDRRTQVIWGIRDFEHRFGRFPEGMWLAETAADTASLEALAEQGIRFTILAPHQAARVRPLTEEADAGAGDGWQDVSEGRVDPTRPYLCRLPGGREIVLFFYDGPISRGVAFDGLLRSGDRFADRLTDVFRDREGPQLGHIATDGETYGHHHRHGDMALARALRVIEERRDIRLTNYGEYLERHPPGWEVEIVEGSSWSCVHGVERWRSDCGCSTGGDPEWHQEWRGPLRSALDGLRDDLAPRYERAAAELVSDPWAARDDYIDVILDREPATIDGFVEKHADRPLDDRERVRLTKLLEIQRQALLMYTSCGWFFNELSGIETVQVLRYAGRAIQLAEELFDGDDIESPFLEALSEAESNLPAHGDGRQIYDRTVRDARVDLSEVGAHFAISSLFEELGPGAREYCYDIAVADQELREAGRARLVTGLITVVSRVTKEAEQLSYGVLHLGDHTIHAGVRPFAGEEAFAAMREEVTAPFEAADFTDTIRTLDRHFPNATYNLRSLFRDQRRQVLDRIIQSTLREAENQYRQIYDHNAPLMRYLHDHAIPMPTALSLAGGYVLNTDLVREVSDPGMDLDRVGALLEDAERREIELDREGLGLAYQRSLEAMAARLAESPNDIDRLERLGAAVALVEAAPFEVSLWNVQNAIYDLRRDHSGTVRARAAAGEEEAGRWLEVFREIGRGVGVAVE